MNSIQVGDVVGDYTVIDTAGSGGMGTVYKIEHVITKRVEAMKLLPPGLNSDPDQVRRFEREIQVQARLHHPNIVALYTAVRAGSSIALVMEFVEGESLQRKLAAGPLPVETAVDFAIQVLRALAYAHASGVIHRDVSPANIIITRDLEAKLTDFGLALGQSDVRLSNSGVPLGSPWYMSPEQVKGSHEVDARTDLYAMGAVLHEMLTGKKLFEAEGAFAVMRAHVEAEPQAPSSFNPAVPAALDRIVAKALAKDSAMRFQSADEFRLALEGCTGAGISISGPASRRTTRPIGLPSSRIVLMALVPAVLAAGISAIRFFPATARRNSSGTKPASASISSSDVDRSSPAATARVEPEHPTTASTPPEVPLAIAQPAATVLPRTQPPGKAMRRVSQPQRNNAIRITGGESLPAAAVLPPRRDLPIPAEAPEPTAKTSSVEAPDVAVPVATPMPADPATPSSQEAAPANPPNTGNRFVRALGRVNPFRKWTRNDAAKSPPKKD